MSNRSTYSLLLIRKYSTELKQPLDTLSHANWGNNANEILISTGMRRHNGDPLTLCVDWDWKLAVNSLLHFQTREQPGQEPRQEYLDWAAADYQ
jgi:hypothetical protein